MMLLCGIAMMSTSCKNEPTVNPEVENGTMTVGWKFEAENGKLYGDYVILGQNTSDDVILEVIRLQLNQARETERAII